MKHKNVFCSWSGGKDCCLALDRFLEANKNCKIYLLTMLSNETKRTYGHNLTEPCLRKQAQALGLEIIFGYADRHNYEEKWSDEIKKLKQKGVTAGVFGDIDVEEHFSWISRVLTNLDLDMIMPLWKEQRIDLVNEVINKHYQAMIVAVKKDKLSNEYLGKFISGATIEKLLGLGIDPSGEDGEFHSLVLGGPLFVKPLILASLIIKESNEHFYLDLEKNLTLAPN